MTVDLSTGGFYDFPEKESEFKELGEGGVEDFQYNPIPIYIGSWEWEDWITAQYGIGEQASDNDEGEIF
ncbi:MAG: hypothetical protein EZS28_055921 [Streblomastix strix]|uniref:Uncharacterized protein n=1 Tax=Streblomastix strix TaxID=222440 RepID=A0A5J4PUQ2_9EUKA|nr:MAG: hypothetical protein EZS28_055921 [Streblomastix strix]